MRSLVREPAHASVPSATGSAAADTAGAPTLEAAGALAREVAPAAPLVRRRVPAPAHSRRVSRRTIVSASLGLIALVVAALLAAGRPSEPTARDAVLGVSISAEDQLVELSGALRAEAGLAVPAVDPALSEAAAALEPGAGSTPQVPGWTVVATSVVRGNDIEELWTSLRASPDARIALEVPELRGWGVSVRTLADGTLQAAVIAAR